VIKKRLMSDISRCMEKVSVKMDPVTDGCGSGSWWTDEQMS
jgi:hypothetical protein